MGQAAGLCGNLVSVYQPLQRMKNCADALHGFSGRIHPYDSIATAVKQAVKRRKQDSRCVVCRMIGLQPNAQDAALTHGQG